MCQNRTLITKYGRPFAPKTKYGTAYVPRSYTHSLRNMEPLFPPLLNMKHFMCQDHTSIHYEILNPSCPHYKIWNSLCAKIIHPFITKLRTPLAPINKYGIAYVPRSYTHSLRNMESLMTPSQNAETLISRPFTTNN